MAKVLIHAYHTNSDNKGRLFSKTEQNISELHSLIDEAISYGYYIQISPSIALSDEHKKNGDILLMFSSKRLVQRWNTIHYF